MSDNPKIRIAGTVAAMTESESDVKLLFDSVVSFSANSHCGIVPINEIITSSFQEYCRAVNTRNHHLP